jgi:lipoate-protein ligase B
MPSSAAWRRRSADRRPDDHTLIRGRASRACRIWVCHLGVVEYREALGLQERIRAARQRNEMPDVLLTLEHPSVYMRGRRSVAGELPMGAERYAARGIEIIETERGGKVTYPGPGQLVGYQSFGSTTSLPTCGRWRTRW